MKYLKMCLAFLAVSMLWISTAHAQATSAQAALSWTDVANEDSYDILRSDDGGTVYVSIGTNAQDLTTFNDDNAGTGLALNVLYCWKVVSVNTMGTTESDPTCGLAALPEMPGPVSVTFTPF